MPDTNPAPGPARKATAVAISFGSSTSTGKACPDRGAAVRGLAFPPPSVARRIIGVSTAVGATALTAMPSGPSSAASDFISPVIPHFVAA